MDKFKMNDRTAEFSGEDIEKNKVVCAFSYLGILFFLPLVSCPNSTYGKFHANQALIILIIEIIFSVAGGILVWIPFLGWIGSIVGGIGGLICAIYAILGIVYTLQGKVMELPLIGGIKILK